MRLIVLISLLAFSLSANELFIAGGAGYKRPITEIVDEFQKSSGVKVNAMFGNMQQVAEQIKQSDKFSIFFGDEEFIKKLGISYSENIELGRGVLVLVYSKNSDSNTVTDLKSNKVKKIGLPDSKKAIYGKAATEFLDNSNLKESLKPKLIEFQTVPQVSSYIVSGDIDAGFINKTDYISIKDKTGSMIEIDSSLYNPIKIVAVVLKEKESVESKAFLEFLDSQKAKDIAKNYGM